MGIFDEEGRDRDREEAYPDPFPHFVAADEVFRRQAIPSKFGVTGVDHWRMIRSNEVKTVL